MATDPLGLLSWEGDPGVAAHQTGRPPVAGRANCRRSRSRLVGARRRAGAVALREALRQKRNRQGTLGRQDLHTARDDRVFELLEEGDGIQGCERGETVEAPGQRPGLRFREQATETAGFYNTVGFNDDTRAFCSIPARHDVARRVDCGYLAELVTKHLLDEDEAREVARDLAYNLAKKAYKL